MAHYLVHHVANDAEHDYEKMEASLGRLKAVQLTEELWLIESDAEMPEVTGALFSDRPPSNRFLVVELASTTAWSAANLMTDPRAAFSKIASGDKPVMIYNAGQPPRRLAPRKAATVG